MPQKEELTTNKIIQIQQLERREPQITKLDADFYERLDRHLKNLQKEYEKEYQSNPASSKTMLLSEELRRAKHAVKDIYDMRERKIILLALSEVKGIAQDTAALAKNEKNVYDCVLEVLKGGREQAFRSTPQKSDAAKDAPKPTATVMAPSVTIEENRETPKENKMVQNIAAEVGKEGFTTADQYVGKQTSTTSTTGTNENKNGCETVFVRITDDIPTFLGSNERIYALAKEDVVSLPKDNAELLCKGGKAVRVA